MFKRIRILTTLGTVSSLCLVSPLSISAQDATPTATPRLIPGVLKPGPVDEGLKSPFPSPSPATATPATPVTITTDPVATPEIPDAVAPPPADEPLVPLDAINDDIPATIEPPVGGAASDIGFDGAVGDPGFPVSEPTANSGGVRVREFQGDELGQVLRLLARQAKIDLVVSETVQGTVTMRLENKTALQAIQVIVADKSLYLYDVDNTFFVKTAAEKAKEPTEAGFYTFSYGRANTSIALLASQILSGIPPQVDNRTNTVFYREFKSNLPAIAAFLELIDKPTRQVMIEARLVEVNANPRQSYGLNWGGVVGSSTQAQTFNYGATSRTPNVNAAGEPTQLGDFYGVPKGGNIFNGIVSQFSSQLAIISAPQLSLTLRFLNEDTDAEFLANPRIVTADNMEATIKIVRNQPVPQLNFNEQTATAVFGGFEDKEFGNKLVVLPSINKDDFVSLSVKPEISNKVEDAIFTIGGTEVFSPVIDQRSLESNVLIKSGDTLAIGGLLQDEGLKRRNKVPILGDIPGLGYLFQEKLNVRTKRNLLVFVTPTIISQGYGTGLEDQAYGLSNSGEEFADPNGWRNNAKGSVRVIPTSNRPNVANYPAPGVAKSPKRKTKPVSGGLR